MADFLFDSSGEWIAWRRTPDDRFIFNEAGEAVGWFPWGDGDAVTIDGDYLGPVVGNRLLQKRYQAYRGDPGYAGYVSVPIGFSDVAKGQLKG